jgi:hypothetical protein
VLAEHAERLSLEPASKQLNSDMVGASLLVDECWLSVALLSHTRQGMELLPDFLYRPLLIRFSIMVNAFVETTLTE